MIQLGDTSVRESLQRYLSLSLDSFLSAQQDFEQRYRSMAGNLLNPMMWLMPPFGQIPGLSRPATGPPAPATAAPPASGTASRPAPEPEPEPAAEPAAEEDEEDEPAVPPAATAQARDGATQEQIQSLKAQVDQIQQLLARLNK